MIRKNVALFNLMPEELKKQLMKHVQIFVSEKKFEGCGGLTINDEIRITIAAQACMLILNRKTKYYPGLDSILVYPSTYLVEDNISIGGKYYLRGKEPLLGESWKKGLVILAWDNVQKTAHDLRGSHNLVLHEFAHQLDSEDGASDGVPKLEKRSSYIAWARVFAREYLKLQKSAEAGTNDVLDEYGTENPAEFFAVATEAFFQKPERLKSKHPELYRELWSYYTVDPVLWKKSGK